MKSWIAGTEYTLKKRVFCPDDGETLLNNFSNQDIGTDKSNVVIIQHEDCTYARYAHLTYNGALVRVGQQVNPGDIIGMSGKSGAIIYHLHFDVTKDCPQSNCQTIPLKFKNCSPDHYPLKSGVYYLALEIK
jgi:hypothetical protein